MGIDFVWPPLGGKIGRRGERLFACLFPPPSSAASPSQSQARSCGRDQGVEAEPVKPSETKKRQEIRSLACKNRLSAAATLFTGGTFAASPETPRRSGAEAYSYSSHYSYCH